MNNMIINYAQFTVYAGIYFGFVVLLNYSLNWRASSHFDVADSIAKGNSALGLRRAGAQIGLAIAMLGVLLGQSKPDFIADIISSVGYGALAIVFIWISLMVTDKVVLPRIETNKEVGNGNVAVSVVEFGTLIMTGLIAFASIYGDNGTWLSSVGYFVLGQVTVILLVLLFEKLTESNNLIENISKGQIASGVYLSGKIIAYGLIMMSAIKGNGVNANLIQSLIEFGVAAGIGMAFLYITELLIDKVVITKTSVNEVFRDDNIAASLQLSGAKIGMALILGFAVL